MEAWGGAFSGGHQQILSRFMTACQVDDRIVAAFLVGSYVKGRADEHSDLDLFLVIAEDAHEDFAATRSSFAALLGEPLFLEDFNIPNIVFLIFADGSEVEIYYVPESDIGAIFDAPFKVLVDKKNIATHLTVQKKDVDSDAQVEKLRRLIYGFWHDFSHFVTAMARNQLWWAHGQLDMLRAICVGLTRLEHDFSDTEVDEEVYFKIEQAMPVERISSLHTTFCPMEKSAMLEAASVLLHFYQEVGFDLAAKYGIPYPEQLKRVMVERFEKLR